MAVTRNTTRSAAGGAGGAARKSKQGFKLPALAPAIMLKGAEKALRQKARTHVLTQARQADPELEREEISASKYSPGDLTAIVSPSLFAQAKLVEITGVEAAAAEFAADLEAYLVAPEPDVWLLLEHSGGNGGRKIVTLLENANLPVVACDKVKSAREREQLVVAEARDAGGSITSEAATMLTETFGDKLLDLLAATRQLVLDTGPNVGVEGIEQFFQGRVESTVFQVADCIANKNANRARALLLLRQAFAAGARPVEVAGALAAKFRAMAKVRTGATGVELGMSPWQAKEAKRLSGQWSDREIAGALILLGQLDWETKGGSRDPEGAVEACLIKIQRLAYAGR